MAQRPSYDDLVRRVRELENTLARGCGPSNPAAAPNRAAVPVEQLLVENLGEVFWVVSPDWQVVHYASPAYERVWGRPVAELKEHPTSWLEAVVPEDRVQVETYIRHKQEEGSDQVSFPQYRISRPDGSVSWIKAWGFTLYDDCGDPDRVVGIALDITDQKRAEEELVEARRREAEAVKVSQVGLWDWDLATDRVRYSPEWKQQLGYADDEISDSFEEFRGRIHPDDLDRVQEKIGGMLDKALLDHRVEFRIRHRDGSWRWIQASGSVITGEAGTPARVIGSHLDITQIKQAELESRRQATLQKMLLDTLPNPVFYKDAEGRYTGCNNAFVEFFGSPREKVIGRTVHEIASPEYADLYAAKDRELLESPGRQRYEHQVKVADGSVRDVVFHKSTLLDEDGTITGLIGIVTDITERNRAEARLLREKERAQQLLKVAGVMMLALDTEKRVTLINPKGCEILGYPEEEILGRDWFETFLPPEQVEEVKEVYDRIIAGELEPVEYYESQIIHKDGTPRIIAWHNAILRDDSGAIIGTFSSGQDVTERREAEEEKRRLETQLRQTYKMEAIGTLAGGIAHDFNNMLGIIMGNLELANDDLPDNSHAAFSLAEAHKACLRAKDMVQQILSFSRQEDQAFRDVDVLPVIKEGLKMLRSSIPSTISIQKELKVDAAHIHGDPTQVHQVLINLCTNAAQAMREEGGLLHVRLDRLELERTEPAVDSAFQPGNYFRLTVSDTGIGMDPDVVCRIFDPYFTTKGVGEGTGMGLAVVHGIVKDHGGWLQVHSEPGQGTAVQVYWPEARPHADVDPGSAAPFPLVGGTEHILVVDDEPALANLTRRTLESLGYTVETRISSPDALTVFRADPKRFDLVISDVTMPLLTGEQLTREMLRIRPDLPVVLCTGFSHQLDDRTARGAGARALVMKPVVKHELATALRRALDRKPVDLDRSTPDEDPLP